MDHQFSRLQHTDDSNLFEDKSEKILILGIGNYLMGDEGVGVHLVHMMEEMDLPDYMDILDGGTGGFFLMNVFDEYGTVIFVDATMDGKAGGTIAQIRPKFASDFPNALSVHDVGLKDMIEVLYLQDKLPDMHLITISVEGIMPMTVEMTQNVEQSISKAIQTILTLAQELHQNQT
jgi:hydrogenase maturation protease